MVLVMGLRACLARSLYSHLFPRDVSCCCPSFLSRPAVVNQAPLKSLFVLAAVVPTKKGN